ncbi:MAG: chromosomal replication initiator protein DnaA [Ignavibacteriaceae bacterium]|jgi:chromosomal replication initiator protein|nr:chromosomal replication initiator protein DnaA [Ignavibacteriaceae bacterium]MCU0412983.1 chromosomal replication initiator protein DnaA [Ignavibacteriaceae bacterium]
MEELEITEKISTKDPINIWKACLLKIKENVSMMTYNTWFLPIKPIELTDSTLKVQIPSQFFWEWIDEHFNGLITRSITDILGMEAKLTYVIAEDMSFVDGGDTVSEKSIAQTISFDKPKTKHTFESNLNPRYTFDNFIKGEGNQLARAAAGAISDNPGGTSFNPLFLYGGVGLGKTHLIQAIGNQIAKNFPEKKVIYLSSDIFTVEFVESIQTNKVNEFSNFYRSMDVLIIDDIQFLIGKEKTQDLFFHIFNTLHQSRKQIILSSDKPPKDLKGLDERLISRFQWGLTADIQPPELETRIAILKRKAETYGMLVSNEILEYIATNITSNIRELEGCLIKLLASVSLNSKEINFELAKKTVKEIATDRKTSTLTIETITRVVCEHLGVAENKIRDKTRKKEIVLARQIAMYLAKNLTLSSLKTIGLHFGGRDHSTVIHACNTIEEYKVTDPSFGKILDEIKNKVELSS